MGEICGDNRFEIINTAKEAILNETNIETSSDEMKVLDSILFRCWQMGWLDKYDNIENFSDGYHTFKELYEYRLLYNAAFFNELSSQGKYRVIKSKRHSDGQLCFGGGWFIVVANLPTGQISNHYKLEDWDKFKCEVKTFAPKWDGHTSQEAAKRLRTFIEKY